MFRDAVDADTKRKEITWVAILCLFSLAAWQFIATFLGGEADFSPRSYEEKVLFGGLGAVLLTSVLYIAVREREQRHLNQRLLRDLREAIGRLNERIVQLHGLCAASAEMVGGLEAEGICRNLLEALTGELPAAQCALRYRHPQRGWLEFRTPDPELKLHISDLRYEVSAPMQINGTAVGVLAASRGASPENGFSPEEKSLLVTLANMGAKALENARLHEELKESYLSSLRTLLGLLGARDNYTATHATRVAALACRLAEYLRLPEDALRLMEEFAPLHDLGKVGIPDGILLKEGPLSAKEREACRQHALIGERILQPLRPDPRALEMVRSHHEGWDGSGYPDGLAGEEIPLLARILHLADAYDALLSERPYSFPILPQQALSEILLSRGREFDPVLAEAFAAMLRDEGVVPEERKTPVTADLPDAPLAQKTYEMTP